MDRTRRQIEPLLHVRASVPAALVVLGVWIAWPVLLAGSKLRAIHRPVDFRPESRTM